jgi:hypothetical protein
MLMCELDLTSTEYGLTGGTLNMVLGSSGSTKDDEFLDELSV